MNVVPFCPEGEIITVLRFRGEPIRFVPAPSASIDLPHVVYRDVLAAFRVVEAERDVIGPLLDAIGTRRGEAGFGVPRRVDGSVMLVSPPWVLGEITRAIGFGDDVWLGLLERAWIASHDLHVRRYGVSIDDPGYHPGEAAR